MASLTHTKRCSLSFQSFKLIQGCPSQNAPPVFVICASGTVRTVRSDDLLTVHDKHIRAFGFNNVGMLRPLQSQRPIKVAEPVSNLQGIVLVAVIHQAATATLQCAVKLLPRLNGLIVYCWSRQHQVVNEAVGSSGESLQGDARAQAVRFDVHRLGVARGKFQQVAQVRGRAIGKGNSRKEPYGRFKTRPGKAQYQIVLAGQNRYPEVSLAELAELAPDLILLPDEPYPFKERDRAAFADIAPTQLIDGRLVWWYGPRMPQAIRTLSQLFATAGSRQP